MRHRLRRFSTLTGSAAAHDLGLVLVHYRTPRLAAAAVERLRACARSDGVRLQLVLVDNGSDAEGRELLSALAERADVELVEPGCNLGYAAAANLGLSRLGASRLGVMNPDVLVAPGCLGSLLRELEAGAGVVGPKLYWDESHRLLLPPGERRGHFTEVVATLGRRRETWSRVARRSWRRHARRHWLAQAAIEGEPSGAMLLFTTGTLHAVGPFDEGYQLYFEETDWLARCRRSGARVAYAPAARAVHLYDQSASGETAAKEWFAASVERFRRRHYGARWSRLLARIEKLSPAIPSPPDWPVGGLGIPAGPHWYEVTPERPGYPAAAELWEGAPDEWELPEEIASRHPQRELLVRIVEVRGRELAWHRQRACEPFDAGQGAAARARSWRAAK